MELKLKERFRLTQLILLGLLGLVEFVRGALFIALIPVYLPDELGVTAFISGAVISAQYGADTVCKPLAGWLVDFFGPRLISLCGLPLALFGLSTFVWSDSLPILLAGAALFGLGTSAVWPAVVSTMIASSPESETATTLGSVYVAWLVGLGAGMVLVNFGYTLGPRLIISLMLIIFCVPLLLALAIPTSLPMRRLRSKPSVRGQLINLYHGLWNIRYLIPGALAQTLCLSMLLPILFPYLKANYGLTQADYGLLTMVGGAVAVIFLLPVGKLVDRCGYRFFLAIGFILGGTSLVAIIRYQFHYLIFPYTIVLGIAYALILPSWNRLIASLLPEAVRASLYSVMMSIEGIGVAVGPVLGGKLGTSYGSQLLFYLSAAVFLLMGVFYYLMRITAVTETTS